MLPDIKISLFSKKIEYMKCIFSGILILMLMFSCHYQPAEQAETAPSTLPSKAFTIEHTHPLADGRTLAIGINHSADTIIIPQSSLLLMLNADTLLFREYYSYMRLLDPEGYGDTSPIPTSVDVVLAIGGEFAETGSFVYVVSTDDGYLLYELKTSPKDGARNEADLIGTF
jgi:hypothetical protein